MKKVKLEDVCEKASSNIKQGDLEGISGEYPIYGASGYIKSVNFYKYDRECVAVVKDGAGIGRTFFLPAYSSVIGTMQYLIPKDNIIPQYLYYAVKGMQLSKYYMGAAIPHIYFKDYKSEEFFLPEKSKQREIVSILERVEKIVESRTYQIKMFDDLIKVKFVELFGDPIQNPKRWDMVTIGDIVTDVRYGTSKPAVTGGKYPYLRMNNLTFDGHLDLSDLKYIDIPDDEIEKCIVHKGDVLFNRTNSIELVGKTAVFDLPQDMVIAGYIIRVRLNDRVLPEILSQYMNLEVLKNKLRSMAKGAVNQANINAQELKKIKVYVPDMEIQKQFVEIKNQVDKSKSTIQKSLDKMQMLFDSLMQQYFS